ncbi:hypothetical protein N7510_001764 [Penicillium lagena]|uniref:uncharacterized protein n=1 Tax=Penicillium lagena TaxID=94218 RepID=UPI0025401717|nr:uncharacterized protein N7510_001764 [Penicillium lagena]KAJ5625455.1 hypothetical protein N7510_001764 [Penicillium lagena]
MHQVEFDPSYLHALTSRTVIITGGAGGIGAATAKVFNEHGANVVIADIPIFEEKANEIIASLPNPSQALFVPVDILNWEEMTALFKRTIQMFGALHVVVANAGIMESAEVLNLNDVDGDGNLRESQEAFKVIDVNLKGTLNSRCRQIQLEHNSSTNNALILCLALRLAMHHMKKDSLSDDVPPSIILVASTSGTGVSAYISSKHGVIGLLRGSQQAARKYGISVKAVAPFFTPTRITAGFADKWKEAGLEENTPEMVGTAIAQSAMNDTKSGSCILVAGNFLRELEFTRTEMMSQWLGQDVVDFMYRAFGFFTSIGGYQLPKISN